ncbi:hypothetical protein FHW83_002392 [Duganella sp. SG902]|uniref:hypothetical protein n=1 Tax=Duganella sp. SG902 TaxID=2587016 RepID=UPI00159E7B84|nr:hypothetical protein [Duganella sp. SG902]NVM76597.1 hypothetical protein [Duganella sp. SG902]
MKHWKLLPLLIAAASYAQRAHAADSLPAAEPSGLGIAAICLGLVVLSAIGQGRGTIIKPEH